MREIRTSGLMSGDGKRSAATAPVLDFTSAAREAARMTRSEAAGSYARTWVTRGLGGALFWRVGHLDAVSEGDAGNNFRQLIFALEPAPGLRRGHDQLEDHKPCRVL